MSNNNEKDYTKECNFCKTKIMMSKRSGSWLPYDLNNGQHSCKPQADKTTTTITKQQKEQITLEALQKKLESIGIILNVERLMKGADYIK
jgi:hypothetical protein